MKDPKSGFTSCENNPSGCVTKHRCDDAASQRKNARMTYYIKHQDRRYSTEGPYWNWKTDKGNIVTSKRLIEKLEKIALGEEPAGEPLKGLDG